MEFEIDKWDMEDIDDAPLNKKNKEDLRMTREYCDEHEFMYGSQSCEPIWDKKTGDLHIYEVIVHENDPSIHPLFNYTIVEVKSWAKFI